MSLNGLDRNKVDGTANAAESFNRPLEFFTVTVEGGLKFRADGPQDPRQPVLDDDGVPNDTQQYLFDKMIELISQKAQPIVLSVVGSGADRTVFNFIVEHPTLWKENPAVTDPKAEFLDDVLQDGILALSDDADNQLYASFATTIAFAATL